MGRQGANEIDKTTLLRLRNENKSIAHCARHFGVKEASIKGALKRISRELSSAPPSDGEGKPGIDAMEQLSKISTEISALLARCNKMIVRIEAENTDIDALTETLQFNPGDMIAKSQLRELLNANLRNTLSVQKNMIDVSGEIRKQVELQLKIAEALHGFEMVAEFKSEILQILKEVSPEVAGKFIKRLKERKAVRGLISMG